MKYAICGILAAALLAATGEAASAKTEDIRSCVVSTRTDFASGGRVNFAVYLQKLDFWVTLHPDGLQVDGVLVYLKPEDMRVHATTVELLQSAAINKRPMLIRYDVDTKIVKYMQIFWLSNC